MADPAADWPAVLLALSAHVRIAGPSGERTLAMDELLTGTYTTALAPGEIITGFEVAKLTEAARWAYVKFNRKAGAFASSLAVAVQDRDGARVVLAAAGDRATILRGASDAMARNVNGDALEAAIRKDVAALVEDGDPYTCSLHVSTVLRAIGDARS